MAKNNPLSVVSVTKEQRRLIGDMESKNDLFTDKEVFTQIVRMENPRSPTAVFTSLLGQMDGAENNMFEPTFKGASTEFIKILEVSEFQEHARILDSSQVPPVLVAGRSFPLTVDRAFADDDEYVQLRDRQTMLRVESRRAGALGTDYTFQLIGQPGEMKVVGDLLNTNHPLFSGFGNSKGEFSANSNTFTDDLEKETTMFNIMAIMRYGFARSGSYMTDETYKFLIRKAMDGSTEGDKEYKVDISAKMFRKVMIAQDNMLMYSVPNFDPVKKLIANRSASGRFPERPTYAGIYWMLDQCPWKWRHSKSATNEENIAKIDFILEWMYNRTGRKQTIVAMASGVGLAWLRDTILKGGMKKYNVNYYQKVEAGEKLKIGFDADEYYTAYGKLLIYDMNQAWSSWNNEYQTASYNGMNHDIRSRHIYLIPEAVKSGGNLRRPCNIYYKSGNGIDRAFVFGSMKGLTGQNGGMTGESLASVTDQNAVIERMMANDRYRMNSTIDGDEMHILTQMVPYLDARNVSRLTIE